MIAISSPVWVDAANRLHLRVSEHHWNTAPGWGWLLVGGFVFAGLCLFFAAVMAGRKT